MYSGPLEDFAQQGHGVDDGLFDPENKEHLDAFCLWMGGQFGASD